MSDTITTVINALDISRNGRLSGRKYKPMYDVTKVVSVSNIKSKIAAILKILPQRAYCIPKSISRVFILLLKLP